MTTPIPTLWWDAHDLSLADDAPVSTWLSKGTSTWALEDSDNHQSVRYVASGINGKPSVKFTVYNDILGAFSQPSHLFTGRTTYSVFEILVANDFDFWRHSQGPDIDDSYNSGIYADTEFIDRDQATTSRAQLGLNTWEDLSDPAQSSPPGAELGSLGPRLLFGGSGDTIFIGEACALVPSVMGDGDAQEEHDNPDAPFTGETLSYWIDGRNIQLGEVREFNWQLSEQEHQAVIKDLSNKWGLALPCVASELELAGERRSILWDDWNLIHRGGG